MAGLTEIKAYSARQQSWNWGLAELGNIFIVLKGKFQLQMFENRKGYLFYLFLILDSAFYVVTTSLYYILPNYSIQIPSPFLRVLGP